MSRTVGHLLDELTNRYIPAYSHLARANVSSLERALALRRMVIAKMQSPPDDEAYAARLNEFRARDDDVRREAGAARQLLNAIIDDSSTPSDNTALARIEARIETAVSDLRRQLGDQDSELLAQLDARDFPAVRTSMAHVDVLRDQFTQRIDEIRVEMLSQVFASTATVMRNQQRAILVSAVVSGLAATLGLGFAFLVSGGITRPVQRLLESTREIEAGRLDKPIGISTRDEIGELSAAFNRMVEQLRKNERVRETFGRYIDPKIVQGLIDRSEVTIRIGIATGEVLAGSIGSELMMSFTVMGDTVNLAARLEAANKLYGTRILISQATTAALDSSLGLREIDLLTVVGQSAPQPVFEIMGKGAELTNEQTLLRTRYGEGLAAYRGCDWCAARNHFEAALKGYPSMALREHCWSGSNICSRGRRHLIGMAHGEWSTR